MTGSLFLKYFLRRCKKPRSSTECRADKTEEKPREETEPYDISSGFLAPDTGGRTDSTAEITAPRNCSKDQDAAPAVVAWEGHTTLPQ